MMYLAFLMLTLIIMLNLLIAQVSDTYAKVQMNARAVATYCRARFMVRYLFILGYLHTRVSFVHAYKMCAYICVYMHIKCMRTYVCVFLYCYFTLL